MVANGTPSKDKGGDFISQIEVGMDHEPLQLADRHFKRVVFRQQQGTTAKSTDCGGVYPIQADFAGNTNAVTSARVAAREEAAIGRHQRGAATDQNKQYDRGRRTADLFISAKWPCCILHALLCVLFLFVLPSLQFSMLSYQVLKATRIVLWRWKQSGHANQRRSF